MRHKQPLYTSKQKEIFFLQEKIKTLTETIDFDDILINAMRNLMVYGNDINKLVGKAGGYLGRRIFIN